jgi:uncharacterized protein YndB with AHSA1/START domain
MPEVRDLVVTRVFTAPPELIWSAFTDPEQIVKFFGPAATEIPLDTVTVDLRIGGTFALVMVNTENGDHYPMDAKYTELVTNERIVFETTGGITGSIQLTDLGDGETEVRWSSRTEFTDELWEGATVGTNQAIDQLGEHLAAIQV